MGKEAGTKKAHKLLIGRIDNRGVGALLFVLIFGSLAVTIIVTGVASYGIFEHRVSVRQHRRDLSFHIAEAGINYYRWHLAHAPTDYEDGTGLPGPYRHSFEDKDGNTIGYFSLAIQPPLSGTSVVIVSSTGWTVWEPEMTRTIQVRMGFPALSDYTFLTNANMAFSFTSQVNGSVHSNGGIRFDGENDSWVKSARDRYEYLPNQWRNGVWGGGGPRSFWQYPVPAIDFFSITTDLDALDDLSREPEGAHLTSSGNEGWHIVFEGSTYDLYRVTSRDCYNGQGRWRRRFGGWYWDGSVYCYDIGNETLVTSNNPLPENGAIFVEDDVWVEGEIDGRVSVGVGRFPPIEPYPRIYLAGDITYRVRSSDDVLGILSQGDVIYPHDVPDTMTIDAAMLSQFGSIHRPFYDSHTRDSLTVFGSQIYYTSGGVKYVNGFGNVISGFVDTNYLYDANLRYFPPPGIPVENTYELISWEELE